MPSFSSLSALLLLPAAISAVTFNCGHIQADGQKFNFEKLGGPKEVNWQRHTAPTITNTTFTIDLCKPLAKSKDKEKAKEECPNGTRICGVQRTYRDGKGTVAEIIPIAGALVSTGKPMDTRFTRLKDSSSHSDSELEGVRGELLGGRYEKQDQKAIIEFLCDKEWEGTEGFGAEQSTDATSYGSMKKREDPPEDGGEDEGPLPDLDKDKALQFNSYKEEKDAMVLRLTWKTKYACEGAADSSPSDGKKSSSLGFFGWFFTIVFLLIAAYIIFGSWLNYNRYGARGWDLIPHGDTIRDIPYIVKDWTSGVADRVKGGGSRGGYSAV